MSAEFYRGTLWRLWLLGLLLLDCFAPLQAQNSTIQGIIADSSGAAVPAAEVTVTNNATGVGQTVTSNEQGFYAIPYLIPGTYSVKAMVKGFNARTLANVTLDVGATARADFKLEIGKIETTIEISASAAILNTETTAVGQVIDNKRVVELPLNGRNYLELAKLTTGVAPAPGARSADKGIFTAVGSHAYQTNIWLDGVDNSSRVSGGQLGFEAQAVTPSIDTVQEFKVVTNNNSAEYGFRMGGTVIVQTKSGTNQYHGTLSEFLRNDKLAANNFFANASGQDKTVYKRNQFGATFGGKIIEDKTFFFAGFEGTRVRVGETNRPTVPLVARKNGNFSDPWAMPLFDPSTTRQVGARWMRDPFPGNVVPSARFDPVSVKLIGWYPNPTLGGATNNYFFSPSREQHTDQYDGRIDHNFSSSQRGFFRYSRRAFNEIDPGPLPLLADGGDWQMVDLIANSYVGNWSTLVSSRMNNEFRFGYTGTHSVIDVPTTAHNYKTLGIKGIPDFGADNDHGVTNFAPGGYTSLGSQGSWPNRNNFTVFQLSDSLTRVQGRHFLKFGFEYRRDRVYRRAAKTSRGSMQFNSSFSQDPNSRATTGDGLADMLLGLASGGGLSNWVGEDLQVRSYALFIQDDLKLARRLTLNLGLRWDRFGVPSFGHLDTFPVGRFVLGPPGTSDFEIVRPKDDNDCGCEHDNNDFAPRVGVAYQLRRSTVLRSGFGLFYGKSDGDNQASIFAHGPPDSSQFSFPTDRLLQPALTVSQGYPAGLFPATKVQQNVGISAPTSLFRPTQYSMQWFLDVQQQLPFDTVLTLSCMGNESRQMLWGRNLNAPFGPAPGTLQSRKSWPLFGNVSTIQAGGNASYNGVAVKAEKRFSKGLTFLAAYTVSHMIDDGAGTLGDADGTFRNPWILSLDRGNSDYDRRQNFVGSFVYDLPFGKGRSLGAAWGSVLDAIAGGWQLGGILTLRTGQPFSVIVSGDPANTGSTNYANRLGSGVLPPGRRGIDRWFDLAAFAVPAQYTYGNGGRNILFGPPTHAMDLKIGKNFRFGEKYRLEFRAEMFNFTNTANFGLPNGTLNTPSAGQITAAGDPRIVQFGLKLIF